MAAKRNRSCTRRVESLAAVARWWNGARAATARLRLSSAPQDAARGSAFGTFGAAGRWGFEGRQELAAPKTKEFSQALDKLGAEATVLLVSNGENENLRLSSRNVPGVTLLGSREVHPYHLLRNKTLIFSEAAARHCSEVLK